ncbi:MAG: ABC transporter permease [Rhizobiaceae bacterium]
MTAQRPAGAGRSTIGRYGRGTSVLLVLPLAGLLLLGFLYPLAKLSSQSFFGPDFTLAYYMELAAQPVYLKVFLSTFKIAFYCTVLALLIGYPLAFGLSRMKGWQQLLLLSCVLIPLWTSVLARSYAWVVLLQRRGVVNDMLVGSGIVSQPLRLLYTEAAVVVAMTHVLLPFMILPIYSSLRGIPRDYERAALSLGASLWRALFHVTLPLTLPGVFAGSVMVFIMALGFYVTPAIIGGSSTLVLATLIGQQMTVQLNWQMAGALSTVLLAVTLVLAVLFKRFLSFGRRMG